MGKRKFIKITLVDGTEKFLGGSDINEINSRPDNDGSVVLIGYQDKVITKESPEEIIGMLDADVIQASESSSELPTGEFTGGEPIPDVEESDYRKECNAMPGTSFKFGELEFLESGFPLLQLLYTNKKGEQKESWIGPFRKYDFSVGPKSNIGCGPSSLQMHFEVLESLNSECRSATIQAFASAAICNWCATYEIVPNRQTRVAWSENKWKDFIRACHKYIFDEESPLV